jgi:HPt (histidine-containing phosphotransfer) domain-containing protein
MRQLNAVLNKFVRDKQPPEIIEAARQKAKIKKDKSSANEAQQAVNPLLAENFARDASKSIAALEVINEKQGAYDNEDMRMYIVHVHGMKSVLANVGEAGLSALAGKLEQAGRDKDISLITAKTGAFLDALRRAVERFAPKEEQAGGEATDEELAYLREKLLAVKEACEVYDKKTAKDAINMLREKIWPLPIRELLNAMAEHLLNGDFEEVSSTADKIIVDLAA